MKNAKVKIKYVDTIERGYSMTYEARNLYNIIVKTHKEKAIIKYLDSIENTRSGFEPTKQEVLNCLADYKNGACMENIKSVKVYKTLF